MPQLRLLRENEVPPSGFRYRHPVTGRLLKAPCWSELLKTVRKHSEDNHVPVGLQYADDVEQQLCEQLPPGHCHFGDNVAVLNVGMPALSLALVVKGTAALLDWWARYDRKKVDAGVARERAAACGRCPFNQPLAGCVSCAMGALHGLVDRVTGGQTFEGSNHIHACVVCGCSLKAKVWLPQKLVREHTTEREWEKLPPHCWIRKEPST